MTQKFIVPLLAGAVAMLIMVWVINALPKLIR
jgi:hypothetical protein